MRCEPATALIEKLGGLTAVAEACRLNVSSVLRWRLAKKAGGTGGLIPARHQAKLVELGADPADFIQQQSAPSEATSGESPAAASGVFQDAAA